MIRFERMHLFRLFVPLFLLSFFYFPSLADELPPDQEGPRVLRRGGGDHQEAAQGKETGNGRAVLHRQGLAGI